MPKETKPEPAEKSVAATPDLALAGQTLVLLKAHKGKAAGTVITNVPAGDAKALCAGDHPTARPATETDIGIAGLGLKL
jgi:hypothetical protein